jgi:hypothetical protein
VYSADSPGLTVCIVGLTESIIEASRAPSANTTGALKTEKEAATRSAISNNEPRDLAA